ncbi:MAG: DUF2169 domain-containing protein [Sandaracinaceae bacterium]
MDIRCYTPFEPFWFKAKDPDGALSDVVVVKATYDLVDERTLVLAEEQEPVAFSDEYVGETGHSSVRYESDLAPHKPRCDVALHATAHAPHGEPTERWRVSVFVDNQQRDVEVCGPRQWEKVGSGWALSSPAPVAAVPLRYEYAFGGTVPTEDGPRRYDQNPIGVGFWPEEGDAPDPPDTLVAPQIVDPERPPTSPTEPARAAGFGFTGRSWQPRLALAGTYDDAWKQNQWPLSPRDFDLAFYNGAADGMTFDSDLRGRSISILHASPSGRVAFTLPSTQVDVRFRYLNGVVRLHEARLDTVFVDLEAQRVILAHRVRAEAPDEVRVIEVISHEGSEV